MDELRGGTKLQYKKIGVIWWNNTSDNNSSYLKPSFGLTAIRVQYLNIARREAPVRLRVNSCRSASVNCWCSGTSVIQQGEAWRSRCTRRTTLAGRRWSSLISRDCRHTLDIRIITQSHIHSLLWADLRFPSVINLLRKESQPSPEWQAINQVRNRRWSFT